MELQKLRYFLTVAQLEHMTRAAEQLHVAQPALSQAIRSLEQELGTPLFVKHGRNITPTECGAYLRSRLETLLPEIDALPGELAQLSARVNKTVKLNILAASIFVVNAIVDLYVYLLDVIFDFEQTTKAHDCDIVISTNGLSSENRSSCLRRCIKKERIYLAVPKTSPYAGRASIDLRELRGEDFVMLSDSRLFGVICNKFCAAAGFSPKILFESDAPAAVQNIISAGLGVAFWPEYSWGKVNGDKVTLLPISFPLCQREIILELYERIPPCAYAADFYDYLIQQI